MASLIHTNFLMLKFIKGIFEHFKLLSGGKPSGVTAA